MTALPQQPLTPQQRHTLLMLYSVRLFYPYDKPTISDMATALDVSRGVLIHRLRILKDKGYISGKWMRHDFVPVAWENVARGNVV